MSIREPSSINPDLPSSLTPDNGQTGWGSLRELTRYHWFVFVVAALGWLADCMDQQLFVLARQDALTELMGPEAAAADVKFMGGLSTSVFLIGWATGGLFFGIMGDVAGRVRTMMLTILLYSIFTGLSALSVGSLDFLIYRFLTGLGVGGEFAVGVALLAETMPERARPYTLGLLQCFSAVGNITAALLYMLLGTMEMNGYFSNWVVFDTKVLPWRVLFMIGMVPAILALIIRRRLQEPERWRNAVAGQTIAQRLSGFPKLLKDSRWRHNALFGLMLAFSGVVGLWGIGFFAPELTRLALEPELSKYYSGPQLAGQMKIWAAWTSFMINIGAFLGMFAFSWVTNYLGRRPTFAIAYLLAMGMTAFVFLNLQTQSQIFWMMPLMGFCQLALFGGYAIYLPELFPTRLRSTGTSFCYNIGRFVAAVGPSALGLLTRDVFNTANGFGTEGFRYAAVTMCSVFLIGLVALIFLPETKGRPLPE